MYSLTNDKDEFYCHIECGCSRKYRAEEMYLCYNCNKLLCRFCLTEEIEYCSCKNNCKLNQIVSVTTAKKMKNSCDQCLECPLCGVALVKRQNNEYFLLIFRLYLYVCPYCYWDTENIKFACKKETELDSYIQDLKESTDKGLLKKMFDHIQSKLKENEGLNSDFSSSVRSSLTRTSFLNTDISYQALESKTWDFENLEKKEAEEEKRLLDKNILKYDDSYIEKPSSYCAFSAVASLLSCGMDYSEKQAPKINSIESLRNKMKKDLDLSFLSSLDQRINHVTFQNPNTSIIFPKYVDLVSKKSKRCKFCKKSTIQIQETPKGVQKPDPCNVMLNQFPYCCISKIDSSSSTLLLKFVVHDMMKEIKVSFEDSGDSPVNVELPQGEFFLAPETNNSESNEFIYSKTYNSLVLVFKYNSAETKDLIIRFRVKAEFVRCEVNKKVEYISEIKFNI